MIAKSTVKATKTWLDWEPIAANDSKCVEHKPSNDKLLLGARCEDKIERIIPNVLNDVNNDHDVLSRQILTTCITDMWDHTIVNIDKISVCSFIISNPMSVLTDLIL